MVVVEGRVEQRVAAAPEPYLELGGSSQAAIVTSQFRALPYRPGLSTFHKLDLRLSEHNARLILAR